MSSRFERGPEVWTDFADFQAGATFTFQSQAKVIVNKSIGSATSVVLPAVPVVGCLTVCWVKDGKGDAATNPITITDPNAKTIDGAASFVLNTAYGSVALGWDSAAATPEWKVLAFTGGGVSSGAGVFSSITLSGLLNESVTDNLTAFAGGGQGSATQIGTEGARFTTVATAGDSGKLPPTVAGQSLSILVINHGAKAMQIYGAGTDTINDVATATGVSQMPSSMVIYVSVGAGKWYSNGLGSGYNGSFETFSSVDNLVAHAGGGQGSGTPITAMQNRFITVASAGDSATMPVSGNGMNVVVANAAAANSMNIFPAAGETINALAANAAFALAAGKTVEFYCMTAGQWHTILSA